MNLSVPVLALRELAEKHPELDNYFSDFTRENSVVEVKTKNLSDLTKNDIFKWFETCNTEVDSIRKCKKSVDNYLRMISKGDTKIVKRLLDIPALVEGYVKKNLPNCLMYREEGGVYLPYLISDARHVSAREHQEAYAEITFLYMSAGKQCSSKIHLDTEDLRGGEGRTIGDILHDSGYLDEDKSLNEGYQNHKLKYNELINKVGSVYVASNKGYFSSSDRYSYGNGRLKPFREDQTNRVVLDFSGYYLENGQSDINSSMIVKITSYSGGEPIQLPIHTYGYAFHLEEHSWVRVHVENLTEYKFKGVALLDKLILSQGDKDMIHLLIEMSKMNLEDIVEGKSGGSFIMATGVAGTGKTLTAEVFSESVFKPLYRVQCSQLGIDLNSVEKNLTMVLKRAGRWGAILLIDEADVYVRSRGTDLQQNAIVGVFLRTLEYYSGILFMTSNLETEIDDAIMSRAVAHLTYKRPTESQRLQIWEVLSEQYKVSLSETQIVELSKKFNNCVGRDIKGLIRLAKMYSEGKKELLTLDTFDKIREFLPNAKKDKLKG